jgi:hypothetical protein
MRSRIPGSLVLPIAFALCHAGPARAEEPAKDAPPVALDALLRLPSDTGHSAGRPAPSGPDRQHWEQRFGDLRGELADAQAKLAGAQAELEDIARGTDAWQMAAPGAKHDPETSPISYKLRSEIRDYREDVARIERRLRELDVEASLAGVPAEWRRPPQEDASPDS